MKIKVYSDADAVALEAARLIAKAAQEAVVARGKFVMTVSGGKTPWIMLRDLAKQEVPWKGVHVVQVDERIAPEGDRDRNLTHLRESLLDHAPLRPDQIHAMPVEATNFETACMRYALTLNEIAGSPAVLDLALGTRTRRPHRFAGAGRPGPRCERDRRCTHENLPEPAAHDANVSDYQSLPSRALARNRKRKSGNACPLASWGCFHSRRPRQQGSCGGFGRSRRRGPSC